MKTINPSLERAFDPAGTPISQLKGLGPKSSEMLAKAGITSFSQLRKLGSVAAYVRTKRANRGASLNLLWALESALCGQHWQEVAREYRTSLLLAVDEFETRERNQNS